MTPKQREDCVVFLDDNLDSVSSFEKLKKAGFDVRRFTDYFPREDNPTKRAANVKDSKIITLCHRHRFLLLTADKEMKTTFWEELSATTIGVVATANNNGDDVWAEVSRDSRPKSNGVTKRMNLLTLA